MIPDNYFFHHLGAACSSIEDVEKIYMVLGYSGESTVFSDPALGVRGKFLVADHSPRIELLEDLPGSRVVAPWLDNNTHIYHIGYKVEDIRFEQARLRAQGWKLIRDLTPAVAFENKLVTFLMSPTRLLIELIES